MGMRNWETAPNEAVIETELLRRYGFFLCLVLRWRRPRRSSSRRCLFASQIRQAPLALGADTMLLAHGISMD
jgi:hypothetical protein